MMTTAMLYAVTPLIPAGPNLDDALEFFTTQLGFAITWRADNMAGVQRGTVEFNLVTNNERAWADNASFSIGVDNLDALYDEYKKVTANVGALEIKDWGRREFHVILPSGVCFQFYQEEPPVKKRSSKRPRLKLVD